MGEFDLISTYFAPLASGFDGAAWLKDDAAVISVPDGYELVVSSDTLNEDIHFFKNTSPDLIAQKALRSNISDIIAKGAKPLVYQLNLSLPDYCDEVWVKAFASGLVMDQKAFDVCLSGGDTTRSKAHLSISITVFGLVKKGTIKRRSGAQVGDDIYLNGCIGDAFIGLSMLKGDIKHQDPYFIQKHHVPDIDLRNIDLVSNYAHAAMDVSDGLVADLEHLCKASKVGAKCNIRDIPLSEGAKALIKIEDVTLPQLITGGDDYCVLMTASTDLREEIEDKYKVHRIGSITEGNKVDFVNDNGEMLSFDQKGWQHL